MTTYISWAAPKILVSPKKNSIVDIDPVVSAEYRSKKMRQYYYLLKQRRQFESLMILVVSDLIKVYWPELVGERTDCLQRFSQYEYNLTTAFSEYPGIMVRSVAEFWGDGKKYRNSLSRALTFARKRMTTESESFRKEVTFRKTAYCVPKEKFDNLYAKSLATRAYAIFAAECCLLIQSFTNNSFYVLSSNDDLEKGRYTFAEQFNNKMRIRRISPKI